MTEPAPSPAIQRAELARQVTENPIFIDAVRQMREYFFQSFVGSAPEQTTIRDEAYRNTRHLNMFENILQGYLDKAAGARAAQNEVDLP